MNPILETSPEHAEVCVHAGTYAEVGHPVLSIVDLVGVEQAG